ncbi:hypothetical protein A9266_06330 [Vibrio tasmaniensis]|nr:hypothetical protein A9266_06330 [Vibrio tasmaniensis]
MKSNFHPIKILACSFSFILSDISNAAYYQGSEDSFIAFEAEGYNKITKNDGENDGFNIVSINEFVSDFGSSVLRTGNDFPPSENGALLADFRYEDGQKKSTVEYNLVFKTPGTYRFYYRRSMYENATGESYGGEDSFYFLTEFNGSSFKQTGSRGDQNSDFELHPIDNPSEGNFHWFNSKQNFIVSEGDVGKEITFIIQDREKGFAIDRLIFSTNVGLDIQESGKDGDGNELDVLPNSDTKNNLNTAVVFPMNFVPYEESDEEITDRESELFNTYDRYLNEIEKQNSAGNSSTVIDELISLNNGEDGTKSALRTLVTLTSEDKYYPQWKPEVVEKFRLQGEEKRLEAIDIINANSGAINDLEQVTPIRRYMDYAWGLFALGNFHESSPEAIKFRNDFEIFVSTYIEGVQPYYDNAFYTGGYNKEVFAMDVASTVSLLYRDTSDFPNIKTAFTAFWGNVTQTSYEDDNSPHYSAGTGFHIILNMALRHGWTSDVINSEHLFRVMNRMARTVMSSGQSAKWGKSMEKTNNGQLLITAGKALQWDLKLGYMFWNDPFYLYVARKYEAFYLQEHGPFSGEQYQADIWPVGIDAPEVSLAKPTIDDTPAISTTRITSCCKNDGLWLDRNDTNYVTVQDKVVVSTGHHPRAPYLMMNLSYTQHKAGQDLRSGIDVHNYNGAHTISRVHRWSEANKNNGIYVNPSEYIYPNAPYPAKQISYPGYPEEFENVMRYQQSTGYKINDFGSQQLSKEAGYGFVSYQRYQYDGVGAKRQIVLLHNGITIVSDTISTTTTYRGRHNGGALYQVLPQLKSKTGENWVLLHNQNKMLPYNLPNGEKETLSTLVVFASAPEDITIRLDKNPYDPVEREWLSASKPLLGGEQFTIISLIIPIQNQEYLEGFINGIDVIRHNTTDNTVLIPYDESQHIQVKFNKEKVPSFDYVDNQ